MTVDSFNMENSFDYLYDATRMSSSQKNEKKKKKQSPSPEKLELKQTRKNREKHVSKLRLRRYNDA